MLTAHRKLHPKIIGKYLDSWEIVDDDMRVIKTVRSYSKARAIVTRQNVNARPARRRHARS